MASVLSLLTVTVVFALPTSSFNCFTLTASESPTPLDTLVILLPPLSKPSFVKETVVVVPADGLIVMPSGPVTVVVVPSVVVTLPGVIVVVPSPSFVTSTFDNLVIESFRLYVKFLPSCLIFKFLPAMKATSLSFVTCSDVGLEPVACSPPSTTSEVAYQPRFAFKSLIELFN